MINNYVVPALDQMPRFARQRNGQVRHLWWAQDGAPAHRRRVVTNRLHELFGNRLIALNEAVEWPPRSPVWPPWTFSCGGTWSQRCSVAHLRTLMSFEEGSWKKQRRYEEIGAWFDGHFKECSVAHTCALRGTAPMSRIRWIQRVLRKSELWFRITTFRPWIWVCW